MSCRAHRMMVVRGFARYLSGIDPRTEVPPAGTIRHPTPMAATVHLLRRGRARDDRAGAGGDPAAVALSDLPDADRAARHDRDAGRGGAAPGPRRPRPGRRGAADPRVEVRQVAARAAARQRASRRSSATTTPANGCCPSRATDSLFVSLRGTRVIYECVWPVHRKLCEHAGVGASSTVTPRIHDHRHCVRGQDAARLVSGRR